MDNIYEAYDMASKRGNDLFEKLIREHGATFPDKVAEIKARSACHIAMIQEHSHGSIRIIRERINGT